jgi:hypothetical protein
MYINIHAASNSIYSLDFYWTGEFLHYLMGTQWPFGKHTNITGPEQVLRFGFDGSGLMKDL